jgi:hypothetical protein
MISFQGTQFPRAVILFAEFFHARHTVPYRDLAETMAGRGVMPEHSPSPLERLNGEIGRRTAIVRLVAALLPEQDDEWAVRRARCMTPETIAPMGVRQGTGPPDQVPIFLTPVISFPAAPPRSTGSAPNITVTISASYTTPGGSPLEGPSVCRKDRRDHTQPEDRARDERRTPVARTLSRTCRR